MATLSISYYDLGYTTGEMAYDILVNGTDIKTMEVKSAPKFTKEYLPDRAKELGITVRTAMRKSQLNKQLHYGGI